MLMWCLQFNIDYRFCSCYQSLMYAYYHYYQIFNVHIDVKLYMLRLSSILVYIHIDFKLHMLMVIINPCIFILILSFTCRGY